MSVADRLNKLSTDITNAYTSIENKGGTIPSNKNTENMSTAIDSIEVIESATAEGESLSLANTKAMPYSDYVVEGKSEQDGEPSPSNPSEIHSVADEGTVTIKQRGKNYFNANANTKTTIQVSNNGKTITLNTSSLGGGAVNGDKLSILAPDLVVGETYKLSLTSSKSKLSYIYVGSLWVSGQTKTITQSMLDSTTVFYSTSSEEITITDMQIVKESEDITNWEPYQGNDYTIQTEPLRSLPNGVKDSKDTKQHRKIGRQTGTLTETTTITLSDAKTNGAYMCNIKPSGTLTGKTIELEAGDYEIIYELEEEIIEPLTQNQANTMLDIIKTGSYEGTTNIYTDEDVKPTIKVGYYKKG